MTGWLASAASAFALIVPVELPDKTFVATLVLATRYRPVAVWAGATAAFAIQCAVAAAAGGVISLLPELPVRIAAAVLFAVGAVLLARGARTADRAGAEQQREFEERVGNPSVRRKGASQRGTSEERTGPNSSHSVAGGSEAAQPRAGWRAFGASFLVLFLAEWGDLSQLLTAGLVASGRPPVPVFLGSWLGLSFVAGMGVLLGRVILRYIRLQVVRYVGASVCAVISVVILVSLITTYA